MNDTQCSLSIAKPELECDKFLINLFLCVVPMAVNNRRVLM